MYLCVSVGVRAYMCMYVCMRIWVCFMGTARMRADGKRTIAWGHKREEKRSTAQDRMNQGRGRKEHNTPEISYVRIRIYIR